MSEHDYEEVAALREELRDAESALDDAERVLNDAEDERDACADEVAALKAKLAVALAGVTLPNGRTIRESEYLLDLPAAHFVCLDTLRTYALLCPRFEAKLAEVERARLAVAA